MRPSRTMAYIVVCLLYFATLTQAAEVRKLGTNDMVMDQTDGAAQETWTSPGGKVVTKWDGNDIPWTNEYTRTIRPLNITGDNTGRIQGFSIGSASYTDNGYFSDLITGGPWVDVRAGYGTSSHAVCDGSTDDLAALQSIIDNVPNGIKLLFPGVCKVAGELSLAGKTGLVLEGKGWAVDGTPVTASGLLYAGNAGRSALSLIGANYITLRDFEIYTPVTTPPKAALVLGRSDSGSYGTHRFDRLRVKGYATQALVYSVASESNSWDGCFLVLDGGGAKYVYYTSYQDNLALTGFTSSSNTTTFMDHMTFGTADNVANAAVIYLQTTDATATDFKIRDSGVYGGSTGTTSSYVEINMAGSGGPFGKILIDGLYAEGGSPTYGLRVTTDSGVYRSLNYLTLVNSEFASVTTNTIYGADNTNIEWSTIRDNYIAGGKTASVYDFDLNTLQWSNAAFTVRNHAFQNDIVMDDTTYSLTLGSNNKNRVFYQKSGVTIGGSGIGAGYVNGGGAAGAVATDIAGGSVVKYTLTDNVTMSAPTNMKTGQDLTFLLVQDGTGGFTVTWDAVFNVSWSDTGNTANKESSIRFFYDGANWHPDGAQAVWH